MLERIAEQFGIQVSLPKCAVAEIGGTWIDPRLRGTGMGGLLTAASIALAPLLQIDMLMGLAHQFHRSLDAVGFAPVPELAPMPYPDSRYVSWIYICEPKQVPLAREDWRSIIFGMRRQWSTQGFVCSQELNLPEEAPERFPPERCQQQDDDSASPVPEPSAAASERYRW